MAAAVTTSTLQGAVLFHDGQFEGRRVRVPVFLRRGPSEPTDRGLQDFYTKLLQTIRREDFKQGQWQLCERTGWPDNQSYLNLVAWCLTHERARHLIVVNLSDVPSQGRIWLPASACTGGQWRMTDEFSGATYDRNGIEIRDAGLYVGLDPWHFHILRY